MEAISYVNIFETKGLEYLLVISFLLGFLLLVRVLSPRGQAAGEDVVAEPPLEADPQATCVADFDCPYRACSEDTLDDEDVAHAATIPQAMSS